MVVSSAATRRKDPTARKRISRPPEPSTCRPTRRAAYSSHLHNPRRIDPARFPLDRWFRAIEIWAESARRNSDHHLDHHGRGHRREISVWRTDCGTGLLGMDGGGLDSVELENRQG